MNAKEKYVCGTCKHGGYCDEYEDGNTCDDWTDPDEPDLTDDEKRANAGCDEAHRIMVEGRRIE